MTLAERLGSYTYYRYIDELLRISKDKVACLVYANNFIQVKEESEHKSGVVLYRLDRKNMDIPRKNAHDFVHNMVMISVKSIVSDSWKNIDSRKAWGMQSKERPHFGDKVEIVGDSRYFKDGESGVIDGSLGSENIAVVTNPRSCRTDIYCNSSGGSATSAFPKSCFRFKPTGRKEWVCFWRYKNDVWRTGNGYDYQLLVWVWQWDGEVVFE
jgi:hypothetical protein